MTLPRRPRSDLQSSELESAVQRLEESWRSGTAPDLPALLAQLDPAIRTQATIECLKVDMEYRWNKGQTIRVEEYLQQWPEFMDDTSAVVELLESECYVRTLFSSPPSEEELHERFPDIAEQIGLQTIIEDAVIDRADLTSGGDATREASEDGTSSDSESEPPVILLGQEFGRYKIVGQIGEGGQGDVYRAVDTRIGRDVALKFPRYSDSKLLDRFTREPHFAASVEHRSICRIYDAGKIRGIHFIAMELIEGETIQQRLENDGTFGQHEAASIARDIATALSKVHAAGILHRDVKSGNIMIDNEGVPVLMDFGLARPASSSEGMTTTESFGGTLAFMSPEQAAGQAPDHRSDIYSLGVVLYQMLTRVVPFGLLPSEFYKHIGKSPPPSPRKLRSDLDCDLDVICRKSMAIRPGDRYQSADEMVDSLQRFIDGRPQIVKLARSRRLTWSLLAAFTLLLAIIVGVFFRGSNERLDSDSGVDQGPRSVDRWIETPRAVASLVVDRNGERLYVADYPGIDLQSNPIREFDVATGQELGEPIAFGDLHVHNGLALSPDGRHLFATNFYFEYISRIDLHGAREPESIRIIDPRKDRGDHWRWASTLVLTPDGAKAVIPMGNDGRPDQTKFISNDQLAIVDVSADPPRLIVEVPMEDEPSGLGGFIPVDENAVYLTTNPRPVTDVPKVYRVELDPPYSKLTFDVPDGKLHDVVVSSLLNRVYIADLAHRRIWVVDRSRFGSAKPMASFALGLRAPHALAFDENRSLLAVVCSDSRSAHILDGVNGRELARFEGLRPSGNFPQFRADGRLLFISCGALEGGVAVIQVPEFPVRIAFVSDRAGRTDQIYTMNGDGTNVKPLFEYASHAHDRYPIWSPDGDHIAFITNREPKLKVCIARRDGTQLRLFESSIPTGTAVSWSPTGDRIAYIAANLVDLHVLDVETGSDTVLPCNLPPPHGEFGAISWETDSSLIVSAEPIRDSTKQEILRANIMTGEAMLLTSEQDSEASCLRPTISRDGRVSVLRNLKRDGPPEGIYLLHENRRHAESFEKLTVNGPPVRSLLFHRWYPNGDKILFSDLSPDSPYRHIFVLDVENKTYRQLTFGDWNDWHADVSPPLPDSWLQDP